VGDNKQAYSFFGFVDKKLLDPSFNPSQLSKLVSKELVSDSYIFSNKSKILMLPVENEFKPSFLNGIHG
jgi:hypothetical protein